MDTCDGILLYVGIRRAQRPPGRAASVRYGKEIHFWTLVVAVLVFAVGGGMSVYERISQVLRAGADADTFRSADTGTDNCFVSGARLRPQVRMFATEQGLHMRVYQW